MESRQARPLLPKPNLGGESSQATPIMMRRKREAVPVACERCRKRKIKCNGRKPSCNTCIRRRLQCQYADLDHRNTRDVLDVLRQGSAPESLNMLIKIRKNVPPLVESRPPESGHCTGSLGTDLLTHEPENSDSLVELLFSQGHVFDPSSIGKRTALVPVKLPVSQWTEISDNDEMLTHLITLFWTWDNMLTRILDRRMFLEDLCYGPNHSPVSEDGNQDVFCSEFLVNAILAASTLYCPKGEHLGKPIPAGRLFAAESHRLLDLAREEPLFPLMQGVALLWLYETNAGEPVVAAGLLDAFFRMYESSGLARLDVFLYGYKDGERAGRERQAVVFSTWGFYCLDSNISLALGGTMQICRPNLPGSHLGTQHEYHPVDSLDGLWFPYPVSSHPQVVYRERILALQNDFAELIEQAFIGAENDRVSIIPDYLASKELYFRLLGWKDSLSQSFNPDERLLPIRVFLSVSSHMLVIKALEPFTSLSFLDFDGQNAVSQTILYSDSIVSDLRHYQTKFGMSYDYWMAHACRVAASGVLPHIRPGTVQETTFLRACKLLRAMGQDLPLANTILASLETLIARDKIAIPAAARDFLVARTVQETMVRVENVRIVGESTLEGSFGVSFSGNITSIGALLGEE